MFCINNNQHYTSNNFTVHSSLADYLAHTSSKDLRVTNVPGHASASATEEGAVDDFVTSLYSCLIIHVLMNLQVHTWGMSLASSGKFV